MCCSARPTCANTFQHDALLVIETVHMIVLLVKPKIAGEQGNREGRRGQGRGREPEEEAEVEVARVVQLADIVSRDHRRAHREELVEQVVYAHSACTAHVLYCTDRFKLIHRSH